MSERKYSFNNFAIGRANQLAYLSVKRTLKNLGGNINPLFIYSKKGLGKTHLVRSVKDALREEDVQYLDGAELKSIPEIVGTVLILENIHLLPDDVRKGMALYNLIKSFISEKKQVYITSVEPPERVALSEQLVSLIKDGLTVPIFPPDPELVGRLFKMLSSDCEMELRDDVIHFLSTLPFIDIREIETVIKKIDLLKDVTKEITVEDVRDNIGLEEIVPSDRRANLIYERDSEFFDFVRDLKKDVDKVAIEQKDMSVMKEEYREKLYIWKMKGFEVKRLEKAMDGPIDGIIQAFVSFTADVQKLVELQRRYGEYEKMATPHEREYLEKSLFDPDAVLDIEKALDKVEARKRQKEEYNKFLDMTSTSSNFVILPSNMKAFEVLKKVLAKEQLVNFPIYIYGSDGCGKTHLLMAFTKKMQSIYPEKVIFYIPARFLTFVVKNFSDDEGRDRNIGKIDAIFLDDIEDMVNDKDGQSLFLAILDDFRKKGKPFVISSALPPEELGFGGRSKEIFLSGTLITIEPLEEEDREVIITNLFARKKVLLSDEIKTFLGEHLTGRFNEIRQGVEKIMSEITEKGLELTIENISDCIGTKQPPPIEEEKREGKKVLKELLSATIIEKKILPSEFDYRWPNLKDRIFEDTNL